ncbi:uncharacterized protein [Misgurnus anguillicaudatus]|uniref:uncharacterized protein isoform X2 n=1 Tax=Misgurnus anguillicaudatus TaxID=75329 RepID=UPI003CCFB6F6
MIKNKRGRGMRPPGPVEERWPMPPPPRGGFHGPGPMGPHGPRFSVPSHEFGPGHPRMMMMMMMDGMVDDRRFMDDGPMDFLDRPPFPPFAGFNDGPDPRFYNPDYGCGPPYGPPQFGGGPSDFCPPEFNDRPGYHMMDPMERYHPIDPNYGPPPPPMDGNLAFGERGGFGPPHDFQGLGPPPTLNAANLPQPPQKTEPPPQKPQKETEPSKSTEAKNEPAKTVASKLSAFKKFTSNPPRGRSLGVITFVGNSTGFIEREDLKKFSFVFNAFYGKRNLLVPGVKVHFTVVKNMGKEVATDVKVAPGGTEDIDSTAYEGVITTTLTDENAKETNPGRVRTIISVDPVNIPFGKADTSITLLLYDRVEFQLVTNVLTNEQRATNIKPKAKESFVLTKEIREKGVIVEKTNETLTIKTKTHGDLPASPADRLSEDELNVKDEVEFTVFIVNDQKKAIRLMKLSEGTLNQAEGNEKKSDLTSAASPVKDKWKPVTAEPGVVSYDISSEKHEGTIVKVPPKTSLTKEEAEKHEPALGLLLTTLEGTDKKLSFRSCDVITKATMMVGDEVQFNISTNSVTKEQRAVNIEILPDSFQTDSNEQRKIGLVVKLDDKSGFIKTQQNPQIIFYMSEVMEETKLRLFEKVEFTAVPSEAVPGGKQAVRVRRVNEAVFTSAPKLEAVGLKEKKKMTIKLKDPKDRISEEDKGGESTTAVDPNIEKDGTVPSTTLMAELKKEQDKTKTKDDKAQDRSRDSSRRRRSRSRSKETDRRRHSRSRSRDSHRRRHSRSRSRSRDRGSSYRRHRSSSRERKDSRYRRSRSREKHRRSNSRSRSRSRERSSRSARKRSRSPENKDDRYKKQTSSKDASNKKRVPSSEDDVDDELLRKKKELMELDEMIARKKAIVAMEQNAQKFEVEVDEDNGVKTFDYQHARCENLWMPEVKPVKSILKKQSDPQTDPHFQASTSKKTGQFVQSTGVPFTSIHSQRFSPFDSPVYSTMESNAEKSLPSDEYKKMPSPQIKDPELLRKKRELDELSESIARKRAIIALEQKHRVVSNAPAVKSKFELEIDDQFELPQIKLWSSDVKSSAQPKKSILKKRSDLLVPQCDSASVDEYGQVKPSQDDSAFTKPAFQSAAASLFPILQPNRSDSFGLFNKVINQSSATLHVAEPSPYKPAVVPKSLAQASNQRPLHEQKPLGMSKPSSSHEDQHRGISPHDHLYRQSPSTSQTSAPDPKRTVTQMERFLSALNKADQGILSSLFQEARKGLDLMSEKKKPQPQLDRQIPFMDDIYDPFEDEDDNNEPPPVREDFGRHSVHKQVKSPMETETQFEDPSQDDLLPHERAMKDGSGFSWLVGSNYGDQPAANTERKLPFGHQTGSDIQHLQRAEPNWFSEQYKPSYDDDNLRVTQQIDYASDPNRYSEGSWPAQKQSVDQNIQHSYVKDREMPDSRFTQSVARQQSEESNEEINEKKEQFEKIQSLLQTIGLELDTGEVSKLADRTRERLYGKTVKRHSSSSHSDVNRELSVSRSDREGSRADSSDNERFRSVSPAQSSSRRVYMSYRDSVKDKDQQKVENVDLTSIKRTITNAKSAEDALNPSTPSSEQTTGSSVSYQPPSTHVLPTAVAGGSQYPPQNPTIPNSPASQYSYYSNQQNPWSVPYSADSSQNPNVQYSPFPYGTMPQPPNSAYAGFQPVPSTTNYGLYTTQTGNNSYPSGTQPVSVPYKPPVGQPINVVSSTQTVRCLKTIEIVDVKPVSTSNVKPVITSNVKPVSMSNVKPISTSNRVLSTINLQGATPAKEEEAGKNQVAAITEDDIKAKQKKRLEQFNQRMKMKKEQQMEALRARGLKQSSTPGKNITNEIRNVWICGHSLVFWAEKRTTSPEFGMQLGMHRNSVRIWWKGVQGMTWKQLLPLLLQLKDNWPKPDLLIVHLGGNDISVTPPETFIETVQKDLTSLKSIFPKCLLVWSDILARQSWRDRGDSKEMDIIRIAINDSIHQILAKLGGSAVLHDNIKPQLGLYRPDGVHLSGKGIDTFNLNLQDFLEKWEGEIDKKADPSVQDANS